MKVKFKDIEDGELCRWEGLSLTKKSEMEAECNTSNGMCPKGQIIIFNPEAWVDDLLPEREIK